jgi:hypothetical protein
MKTDIDICGRQAVAGSALIEFGNPLLQEVMRGDCAAAGFLGRSGVEDRQRTSTSHALNRRALSVAARCTGVSIAPCERTANVANSIY